MHASVTRIFPMGNAMQDSSSYLPDAVQVLDLPSTRNSLTEIDRALDQLCLESDARGLWMGYPNLRHSVDLLMQWVGIEWPSVAKPSQPALVSAIAAAIMSVKNGLERQESDRRFVISNFHLGLATIATDLTGFCAWGCTKQKVMQQWEPFVEPFPKWCASGRFDRVLFSIEPNVNETSHDGLIWKMRGAIAPMHDLGIIHRYSAR